MVGFSGIISRFARHGLWRMVEAQLKIFRDKSLGHITGEIYLWRISYGQKCMT